LSADIVRAESARYTTSLLCIPGLWSAPLVWRGFASYLAHRGWESQLLDVRAVDGGVATRAAAVAAHAAALSAPPVLIGHDVAGDRDPFLPAPAAAALARTIGAQHEALDGAGHWLLAGPAWQRCVGLVHRWLVQRLGEPLLERYAEATAERDEDAEP